MDRHRTLLARRSASSESIFRNPGRNRLRPRNARFMKPFLMGALKRRRNVNRGRARCLLSATNDGLSNGGERATGDGDLPRPERAVSLNLLLEANTSIGAARCRVVHEILLMWKAIGKLESRHKKTLGGARNPSILPKF
jgi:hypothetical protein